MSSDAKTYIKDVLVHLEIPAKDKKNIQSLLETTLAEHGLENAGYNTIAEELGEPQAQAATYAEHFSAFDRLAVRRHRKVIVVLLSIVVAVVVLLSSLIAILAVKDYYNRVAYDNGHYVETIYDGDFIPNLTTTNHFTTGNS